MMWDVNVGGVPNMKEEYTLWCTNVSGDICTLVHGNETKKKI